MADDAKSGPCTREVQKQYMANPARPTVPLPPYLGVISPTNRNVRGKRGDSLVARTLSITFLKTWGLLSSMPSNRLPGGRSFGKMKMIFDRREVTGPGEGGLSPDSYFGWRQAWANVPPHGVRSCSFDPASVLAANNLANREIR